MWGQQAQKGSGLVPFNKKVLWLGFFLWCLPPHEKPHCPWDPSWRKTKNPTSLLRLFFSKRPHATLLRGPLRWDPPPGVLSPNINFRGNHPYALGPLWRRLPFPCPSIRLGPPPPKLSSGGGPVLPVLAPPAEGPPLFGFGGWGVKIHPPSPPLWGLPLRSPDMGPQIKPHPHQRVWGEKGNPSPCPDVASLSVAFCV